MKKRGLVLLLSAALAVFALAGCSGQENSKADSSKADSSAPEVSQAESVGTGDSGASVSSAQDLVVVKVGASPTPHGEILAAVKELMAEEGFDLQIVEFNDYVLPNLATESGEIDANYFQHITYLTDFNEKNNTHLVSAAEIHYEPFGLYPGKTSSLEELADGATIAIPNDGTNEARALLLLEAQGLIRLKEDVGVTATKLDIVENPKNLNIQEIEAAQLPRSLQDVDMAVINGNYALQNGLKASTDAVAVESEDSEASKMYVNVLAVKEGNETNPGIVALIKALKSEEAKAFMDKTYEGAVVPKF